MTIVMFAFCMMVILSCRITDNSKGYLTKEYTNTIKGIFIFFVFIRHFQQYDLAWQDNWIDSIGRTLDAKGGQLLVTMFLFYSGYGIMESLKKKGEQYVSTMPVNRILNTLINFDVAVIIYILVTCLMFDYEFSIKRILLSFIGWDNYGNSNWYILCILVMYIISYFSLRAFKGNKAVFSIFVGTILFTMFMSLYKDTYWYNTAFCYVLGCAYSVNKEKIEEWLVPEKRTLLLAYMVVIFLIAYEQKGNIIWYHIHTVAFVLIVLMLTQKISIKNKILMWMGENLFPLYIFQRLPMMLLRNVDIMKNNPPLFFGIVVVLTVVIAIIYNYVIQKNINRVLKTIAR